VTVENIPFQETDDTMDEQASTWWNAPIFMALMKNLLIGGGFLALLFLVIRPLLNAMKSSGGVTSTFEQVESAEEQMRKIMAAQKAQLSNQANTQMELIEKVKQEPYQTSQVLKNWIESKK